MSIRENLQKEIEKLRDMSWQDRIWYIWSYYKFHLLGALLAVGLIYCLGTSLYHQTFTTRLSIAVINDRSAAVDSASAYSEELAKALGYGEKDILEIYDDLYLNYGDQNMSQYEYAGMTKIAALIASGSLDVIVTDKDIIEYYGSLSGLTDLSLLLPETLSQSLNERLIFVADSDGVSRAVGIAIKDTDFARDMGIAMDEAYLAVLAVSPHPDESLRLIEYIFSH